MFQRLEGYGIYRHIQQYFSYVVHVSIIGGGNIEYPQKTTDMRKSLTSVIS
jgi:hypothetical protein